MRIDLLSRHGEPGWAELKLLRREFSILELPARNAESLVTRSMLHEEVWKFRFDPQTVMAGCLATNNTRPGTSLACLGLNRCAWRVSPGLIHASLFSPLAVILIIFVYCTTT